MVNCLPYWVTTDLASTPTRRFATAGEALECARLSALAGVPCLCWRVEQGRPRRLADYQRESVPSAAIR